MLPSTIHTSRISPPAFATARYPHQPRGPSPVDADDVSTLDEDTAAVLTLTKARRPAPSPRHVSCSSDDTGSGGDGSASATKSSGSDGAPRRYDSAGGRVGASDETESDDDDGTLDDLGSSRFVPRVIRTAWLDGDTSASRLVFPRGWPSVEACTRALSALHRLTHDYATDAPAMQSATPFHSSAAPPFTVVDYAQALLGGSKYGIQAAALALGLMRRWAVTTRRFPGCLTVHRLLLACCIVGLKAVDATGVSLTEFARVGGVGAWETARLEACLMYDLRFCPLPGPSDVSIVMSALASDAPDLTRAFA
eukprot:CAMPEP_0174877888 /NCGR_PEP_ID=MMETSP1114-20130205/82480_1 /TAXON_ID=312471 /ORGANISM="Neobodo designis, Strain CCAP 1951/1" /LENGTH=308 /DNA_ID=CAMNT_0016113275 /DNA_START=328 /DNA_END=1254 /DNA_ORIENTATION=-